MFELTVPNLHAIYHVILQDCGGDPNDKCGGNDRMMVYEVYPRPWVNGPSKFIIQYPCVVFIFIQGKQLDRHLFVVGGGGVGEPLMPLF